MIHLQVQKPQYDLVTRVGKEKFEKFIVWTEEDETEEEEENEEGWRIGWAVDRDGLDLDYSAKPWNSSGFISAKYSAFSCLKIYKITRKLEMIASTKKIFLFYGQFLQHQTG